MTSYTPAPLINDFYKISHPAQYPKDASFVYSNMTARSSKHAPLGCADGVVVFGIQAALMQLVQLFEENFFKKDKKDVMGKIKRRLDTSLGVDSVNLDHLEALHDYGRLPLTIKALPEGTIAPIKVPFMTLGNSDDRFAWVTNSVESLISNMVWKSITAATIARAYRKTFIRFAEETGFDVSLTQFQGHDFSFRGLSGISDSLSVGAAHLTSFVGTDTVHAIDYLEAFYKADADKELIGTSVPATEHSVMSMGLQESELDTFTRLISEIYPSGFISIVSDTWDFWKVVTEYLPALKEKIMARDGRVVIRPDSGDPTLIICGDPAAKEGSPENKGLIQCLWETFGGTITSTGHKLLDNHIGAIYGDSIDLARQTQILQQLADKGFCSGNIVFGIGSFSYQYLTRDTFGIAVKATAGVRGGELIEIFKNPKTDDGTKKSAKGLIRVDTNDKGIITLYDQQTWMQETKGMLREVLLDGDLVPENLSSLSEIRNRILNG